MFLKKKDKKKRIIQTNNYKFDEEYLDEYTDIQIEAFLREYYKKGDIVNQSTAYDVPDRNSYHISTSSDYVGISRENSHQDYTNITFGGVGVWCSKKRTLAKIINK